MNRLDLSFHWSVVPTTLEARGVEQRKDRGKERVKWRGTTSQKSPVAREPEKGACGTRLTRSSRLSTGRFSFGSSLVAYGRVWSTSRTTVKVESTWNIGVPDAYPISWMVATEEKELDEGTSGEGILNEG